MVPWVVLNCILNIRTVIEMVIAMVIQLRPYMVHHNILGSKSKNPDVVYTNQPKS